MERFIVAYGGTDTGTQYFGLPHASREAAQASVSATLRYGRVRPLYIVRVKPKWWPRDEVGQALK